MPTRDLLGEFELYVLAALQQLGDDAYGVAVRDEIERRSGRASSAGAVYATLARLADKGYVRFELSDPLPMRGGRSRKYARLTAQGRRAFREAIGGLARMVDGLDLGWQLGGGR